MLLGMEITNAYFDGTGIGRYTKNIYKELSSREGTFFISSSLPVKNKVGKFLYIFWKQFILPWILYKKGVRVFFVPQNIGIPLLRVCKYVVAIHDVIPIAYKESWRKSKLSWMIFVFRQKMAAHLAKTIVTVSEFSKNDIVKYLGVSPEKVHVVYLGVEEQYQPIRGLNKADVYLKFSRGQNFILGIGSNDTRKNVQGLINAFIWLKQQGAYSGQLVIIGNQADFLEYLDKDILFTGLIDDFELVELYNAADVFVYPSFYEGFGLPPLEAMACGTPVIASNLTSLPEILKDAAYFVDPYDFKSIGQGILDLLQSTDLKQCYIDKGLALIKLYKWKSTAENIYKICRE